MKSSFSFWNLLFFVAVVGLLYQKAPVWWSYFQSEGQASKTTMVKDFQGQELPIPIPNRNQVLVFWATWCGPCKVEMARLNRMVKAGELQREDVLAISIMEEAKVVEDFMREKDYQFVGLVDSTGEAARQYNVSGTPTIVFVDEAGIVEWQTMGLSPSLEMRVKRFVR